jgi:hypothetical protein
MLNLMSLEREIGALPVPHPGEGKVLDPISLYQNHPARILS